MATIDLRNPGSDEILLSSASTDPITGSTVGLASASAALQAEASLSGSSVSLSVAVGSLVGDSALDGSSTALSSGNALLQGDSALAGSTVGQGVGQADLAGTAALDGSTVGLGIGQGALEVQTLTQIEGSTVSLSGGLADLTIEITPIPPTPVSGGGRVQKESAFRESLKVKLPPFEYPEVEEPEQPIRVPRIARLRGVSRSRSWATAILGVIGSDGTWLEPLTSESALFTLSSKMRPEVPYVFRLSSAAREAALTSAITRTLSSQGREVSKMESVLREAALGSAESRTLNSRSRETAMSSQETLALVGAPSIPFESSEGVLALKSVAREGE